MATQESKPKRRWNQKGESIVELSKGYELEGSNSIQ